jgi:hypothetical protein
MFHPAHRLFSRLRGSSRQAGRQSPGRGPRYCRPRLEALEDRTLPATVLWANPNGGDWATASNWSTGRLPGVSDDVVIDVPGNVSVTHAAGADAIHSLTSQKTIVLSGGTLSLSGDSVVNNDTILTGGTLAGDGDLAVNGLLIWTDGAMSGSGHTLANNGLVISGSAAKTLTGRTLDNAGMATWSGSGNIVAINNATFNNLASATFNVLTDATFGLGSGVSTAFNNAGTLSKVDGNGTSSFATQFNNSGTVQVQFGTLLLAGGGVSTGSFGVDTGASLNFGGAVYNVLASSSVMGPGDVTFVGGSQRITVVGSYAVTGNTRVVSGFVDFASDATLASLTLSGGELTGLGTVTVNGLLTWTGGAMTGLSGTTNLSRTIANGGMLISGPGDQSLTARTLDNAATATWSGSIHASDGAVVNNLPRAVFDAVGNVALDGSISTPFPPVFNNAGTFRKSAGTGTTRVNVRFSSTGVVEVQTGTLLLGPGNSTGTFTVPAGTTLVFAGQNLLPTSRVSGAGDVLINALGIAGTYEVTGSTVVQGTATFSVDVTLPNLTFSSGGVTGDATVTVTGVLQWLGGTMAGRGRTVAAGGLVISGDNKSLTQRTIDSLVSTTLMGPGSINVRDGAVFNNPAGAVFTVAGDVTINWPDGALSTFNNAGILRKTAGNGTATIDMAFNNSGTVEVQSGNLNLSPGGNDTGQFTVAAGARLTLGAGPHAGTHVLTASSLITGAGDVTLGTVDPQGVQGQVRVLGAYEISGTTTVNGTVEFTHGVTFPSLTLNAGTLDVTGDATVNGLFTWALGTMTGPGRTRANGGLIIGRPSGGLPTLNGRTVDNAGTATWMGFGGFLLTNAAVFNNLAGATFIMQESAAVTMSGATPSQFNNAGTFRKLAGSGTTAFAPQFNNSGTVDVLGGTLTLNGGGAGDGRFTVAAGAALNFGGGTFTLGVDSAITGPGAVTFSGAAATLTNVRGVYNVAGSTTISGGTVDFANDVSLSSLTLSDGTLAGSGDVTVNGTFTWLSGTMTGLGRTIANSGLNLGTTSSTGQLTLDGRTLVNVGTAVWAGRMTLLFANGAVVNNVAGAVFLIENTAQMTVPGATSRPEFDNAGVFRNAPGSAATDIRIPFNNTGSLEVLAGSVTLAAGGTGSGTFTATAPGHLFFGQSTYLFADSSSITGTGTVEFFGNGGFSPPAEFIVRGSYGVSGETVVSTGFAIVSLVRPATLARVTVSGSFFSGDITVTDQLVWNAGTLSGHIRINGTLIGNSGMPNETPDLTGTLDIAGTAIINGINAFFTGGVVNVLSGATFAETSAMSIRSIGGLVGVINNAGTMRFSHNATTTSNLSVQVNNSSTVEVQSGTLLLASGGTSSGSFLVSANATLVFASATHTLLRDSLITGPGNVTFGTPLPDGTPFVHLLGTYALGGRTTFVNGVYDLISDVTTNTVTFSGGTLTGVGNFTVTGQFTWTGGFMSGTGQTFANGATDIFRATLEGRTFTNGGSVTLRDRGGIGFTNGAIFSNLSGATVDLQGDINFGSFPAAAPFNNAGTFLKSGGTGTSTLPVLLTNTGTTEVDSGTLVLSSGPLTNAGSLIVSHGATFMISGGYTQRNGSTTLHGGTLTAASVNIQAGTLSGPGTINGNVTNAGLLTPGGDGTAGALTINGNFIQTTHGSVSIALGGLTQGTEYGLLVVTGQAILDGTLTVILLDDFQPQLNDTFQILTFGSRSGTFATTNFPDLGDTLFFDPVYDNTSLTLVTRSSP